MAYSRGPNQLAKVNALNLYWWEKNAARKSGEITFQTK